MYKVVIADDERMIREGLSTCVEWAQFGFEVVQIFKDGDDLIEYIKQYPVDLVITDIKMQSVSGIDVSKYCYENKLNCKIVFISAYQEFELAKAAMKYGVKDYLLKPVEIDVLEKMLEDIKNELEATECRNDVYFELESDFLKKLVLGVWKDAHYVKNRMRIFYPYINPEKCICVLADVKILDYELMIDGVWHYGVDQFDNALKSFCGTVTNKAIIRVIYKDRDKVRLFVLMKEYYESEKEQTIACEQIIQTFKDSFEEVFTTGVGVKTSKIYHSIFEVGEEQHELFLKKGEGYQINIMEKRKLIMDNLLAGSNRVAYGIYLGMMENELRMESFVSKKEFAIGLFAVLNHIIMDRNTNCQVKSNGLFNCQVLLECETEKELMLCIEHLFGDFNCTIQKINMSESIVECVIQYIEQHIMEDINMETVSNQMYISVSYLVKIFKENTGETFLQYVTRKKMEKAAQMIRETNYNIYEIGEMLGYRTSRYFSKLFYEYMNCYPKEYRKKLQEDKRKNAKIY